MKTNQLKKGASVMLRNGWKAELVDNMRGNTRLAKVYGDYTEVGSIYAHNIVKYKIGDSWYDDIVHTKSQKELMALVKNFCSLFFGVIIKPSSNFSSISTNLPF